MSQPRLTPARQPTMYFVGVTTGQSAMMRIFPAWAERLGLEEARLTGVDFPLGAPPAAYRALVRFLAEDPLSLGALVTTHKIDVLHACRDLFDALDPQAELLGEVSCIAKAEGRLVGSAVDGRSGLLALDAFLPRDHWRRTGAHALFLGAGGAAVALTTALLSAADREPPASVVVADVRRERLDAIERIHRQAGCRDRASYHLVSGADAGDALVGALPPASLVVNGTGLGKDRPGSPLTAAARFPAEGFAWDFNYRGDLVFLEQARAAGTVHVEDGWRYFLYGWTLVLAQVFGVEIEPEGLRFQELAALAEARRG